MTVRTLCILVIIATLMFALLGCSPDLPNEIIGEDGVPMILISAGKFQMGTDTSEIPRLVQWSNQWQLGAEAALFEVETPRHTVHLDAFYIGKYEVTNAQYRRFVKVTGHREPEGSGGDRVSRIIDGISGWQWQTGFKPWLDKNFSGDNQPVVCVSWEDAKAYCEWAGKRLPTEAEWEKAARGNLTEKRFIWGDTWPPPKGTGNFPDEVFARERIFSDHPFIETYDDSYAYTAPVGSFAPNGYGVYDMAGNVWEWCADWRDEDYYAKSPRQNPIGPETGKTRVVRGGSWLDHPSFLRVALRGSGWQTRTSFSHGFRCAKDVAP